MAMASARLAALAALAVLCRSLLGPASAADGGEARALLALKAELDPTGRLLPSWAPGRDPCRFEGVACDGRGAVANVSLQGKGLAGTLSPAVAGLRSLTGLYLHYNALRGAVPRELSRLTRLTDVYLNVNNFSGPVPPEIGAMASLQGEQKVRALCFFSCSTWHLPTCACISQKILARLASRIWTLSLCHEHSIARIDSIPSFLFQPNPLLTVPCSKTPSPAKD
jgi:hypothetical protein